MRFLRHKSFRLLGPVLWAALPMLFLYASQGTHQHPLSVIFLPIAGLVLSCVLGQLILYAVCRQADAACLVMNGVFVSFISPIAVFLVLVLLRVPSSPSLLFVGPVCVMIAAVLVAIFKKGWHVRLNQGLCEIGLVLCAINLISIVADLAQVTYQLRTKTWLTQVSPSVQVPAASDKPDIFYILLDGCPAPETYKARLDYDNSAFQSWLERRGFLLPKNAFCNYAQTELSMCSSLNMQYLDPVARNLGGDSDNFAIVHTLVQNNDLVNLCKRAGYRFINVVGGPEDLMFNADRNANCWQFDSFAFQAVRWTPFGVLNELTGANLFIKHYRQSLLRQLNNVSDAASGSGPKFVYAHINLPHPPMVFDAQGKPVNAILSFGWPEWSDGPALRAYVEQTKFVESRLEQLIDTILAKQNGRKTVIVIHSDHGPCFGDCGDIPAKMEDHDDAYLYHRMRIFYAILLPESLRASFPQTISPVNTARWLFSNVVGCKNLPLLPDRSFYGVYKRPYALKDVTYLYDGSEKKPPR